MFSRGRARSAGYGPVHYFYREDSMISLTKLLLDTEHFGDRLRYSGGGGNNAAGAAPGMGPGVVWNCTRACNLACRHCYASATPGPAARELTTQ